jgi:glycosyltransferase involved in cell wall biosynthesis
MSAPDPSVVYVLPDKVGGVVNFVDNLLIHRRDDGMRHEAILLHNRVDVDTRFDGALSADAQRTVEYELPPENLHAVLARLARAIPRGPGVLVTSDWLELAMLSVHDTGRSVVAIVHGDWDYYYDLAVKHQELIHAFVAYSRQIHRRLLELLPERHEAIHFLPYGVAVPAVTRRPAPGPLRLLFVGRMTVSKGILDLPAIDARLAELGVEATWTLQGTGPEEGALRRLWDSHPRVRWSGLQPMERVLAQYLDHDVLVLPCRHEGLPVALLEAMAAGVVPVISDLASGIRDVVDPGVNGFRPPPEDPAAFAAAIATLAADRERLEAMGRAARATVVARFDASRTVEGYQDLYARWRQIQRPRPAQPTLHYGSRLDRSWLPNSLVYQLRQARRWLAREEG